MSAKSSKKNKPRPHVDPSPRWLALPRLLLVGASLGAAYLAWVSFSNGPVAGCGPESGCSKVLQSRWAYWLGIPVSVPAVLAYLSLLGATLWTEHHSEPGKQRRGWMAIIVLSVVIAGAALWFVGLQVFVLRSFCKFCMAAHACGLLAAALLLKHVPSGTTPARPLWSNRSQKFGVSRPALARYGAVGLAGVALLAVGQILVQKQRHVVKPLSLLSTTNGAPAAPATDLAVTARSNPPAHAPVPPAAKAAPAIVQRQGPHLLSLYDGQFQLNLNELPLIGSPDAPHVIVSLFDYTCHHCRDLHPLVIEAQRRFSNQLAVVALPMPLSSNCNPVITRFYRPHALACDYARLGLAVWRADRNAFPEFDHWLFAPPQPVPVEQARQQAEKLVGADKLATALADDWIARTLRTDGYLYATNYHRMGNSQMPQLIIGSVISFGPLNSVDELCALLERQLGMKR